MIVVDASVAVKWFVDEPGHDGALAWTARTEQLVAPDFVLLETMNVLRRKFRLGNLMEAQLQAACSVLPGYFDRLIPASHLITKALALSAALNHSLYDCAYLACAQMVDSPLLTADIRFADKAERAGYDAFIRRLGEGGLPSASSTTSQ